MKAALWLSILIEVAVATRIITRPDAPNANPVTLKQLQEAGSLPDPPSEVIKARPEPLKNAALWQEALKLDAANKAANGNPSYVYQQYYSQLAWLQSVENSSHHYNVSASPASRALQRINNYPTRFDQAQAVNTAETIVEISSTPHQTIDSFGASGAWWPNFLNDFPTASKENLSDLLFSNDWLSLTGYRYNMGASGNNESSSVSTPGRGVQSFLTSNGTYDWTRDAGGVYYLRAAAAAKVSITFFVNAIPSVLTRRKKPCGTFLESDSIPSFTAYIKTVLAHWSSQGIPINSISPMNEPDNSFSGCQQEGMSVFPSTRAAVFSSLRTALASSPTTARIKITGDETSQIVTQALPEYKRWLPSALSSQSIDTLAVHAYDFPDDATLLNYHQLIKDFSAPNPPPPIRMTEISTFKSALGKWSEWGLTGPSAFGAQYNPSISSALDMARMIWQWLTLVHASGWDWWTAVSNQLPCSLRSTPDCENTYVDGKGYNDGLIYIDPNYAATKDYTFYLTKRFWVFRHFTRFLRPGSVRYEVPNAALPYGAVAVAAKAVGGTWSAVFVHRNATAQSIRLKLPGQSGKVRQVVQTTELEDWASVEVPAVDGDGIVELELPARGVLSLQ